MGNENIPSAAEKINNKYKSNISQSNSEKKIQNLYLDSHLLDGNKTLNEFIFRQIEEPLRVTLRDKIHEQFYTYKNIEQNLGDEKILPIAISFIQRNRAER